MRGVLGRTHTRTYVVLDAWAETLPHVCAPGCTKPHVHAGDVCAVGDCGEALPAGQVVYATVELDRDRPGERWVCWRHIRPDDGPIAVEDATGGTQP